DFDVGDPFAQWDRVVKGSGYGATVDSVFASSLPNSLVARIEAGAGDGCAYARPEKTIDGAFNAVRLGLALRLEGPERVAKGDLASVNVASDLGGCQSLVEAEYNGANYVLRIVEQLAPAG